MVRVLGLTENLRAALYGCRHAIANIVGKPLPDRAASGSLRWHQRDISHLCPAQLVEFTRKPAGR